MNVKEIAITCEGQKYIPIAELADFQGNLKTLEKPALEKLKKSILKHGFSFPVFVWRNYILDGHQRVFATRDLLFAGYSIADIPVVEIHAKNKKEAAEKLLVLNSHYAKITEQGLSDYISNFEIDLPDLSGELALLDIEIEKSSESINDQTKARADIEYVEKQIRPYVQTHVLLSFPPEKLMEIQKYLKKIIAIEGVEYEQSSN